MQKIVTQRHRKLKLQEKNWGKNLTLNMKKRDTHWKLY